MGTKSTSTLSVSSWIGYGRHIGILAFLFMALSPSTGVHLDETPLSSSQRQSGLESSPGIPIGESINGLTTKGKSNQISTSILSTESPANSSYIEKAEWQREKSTSGEVDLGSGTKSDYYDIIQPTKTVSSKSMKIKQTVIKENSGEAQGVSMRISRPQKQFWGMNYRRVKRGYGNSVDEEKEDRMEADKSGARNQRKKKTERSSAGKSYNEVAESLEKIARVTVNSERDEENKNETTVDPLGFRESRDEENRKASPDIQDIITGIVNILNGKGTKQGEPHAGRPARPTNVRINNRGPPKISDVPPLDFDGPSSYRPLPPPPPKRIPPPYAFDVPPPSLPNIPLPPQPHKPSLSKLPTHPFLEGVPIPELVIPTKNPSANRPGDHIQLEYDTISASEPLGNQNFSIIELKETLKPEVIKTTTLKPETTTLSKVSLNDKDLNSTSINATHTKADQNKTKPGGSKPSGSNSSPNKNSNKRVRPSPGHNRPNDKGQTNKPSTTRPVVKEDKNKTTESVKVDNTRTNENQSFSEVKNTSSSKPLETTETSMKKRVNQNQTEVVVESIGNSFKPSPNISVPSSVSSVTMRVEVDKNKTMEIKTGNGTIRISTERTVQIVGHNETKYEIDLELPVLLEPSLGYGEATPVLESSIPELSLLNSEQSSAKPTAALNSQRPLQFSTTTETFKVRPGIVLDDPEYKPGLHKRPVISARPIVTAPPTNSYYGEIFDVTVHAVQGPGEETSMPGKPYIIPVDIDGVQLQKPQVITSDVAVITKPEEGQKFVSIDGKRTYINLFGEPSPTKISPTSTQATITGTGYAIPHKELQQQQQHAASRAPVSTTPPRRPPYKRPSHPPVRIDTCIVGDDSTCDSAQNEMCKTEDGVSSCHCRPGYNRKKHRDTCRRVVSMLTSIRVDRLYDKKLKWQDSYTDPDSEDYQQLSYEASQAIESAMSMTPFSDDFINSRVNSIYLAKNLENNEPAIYVNMTIQLEENLDTVRPAVKHDIQRHLLRVVQRRNNNLGNSAVWVDAPPGSVLALQDVDECSSADLHDCHERATCLNTFGSFKCQCSSGLRDPWVGNVHREGRFCETCPSDYCNGRGECQFEHGQQVCHCSGNFYGSQCEIDGEVLGVAIGASVAAAIIIILTLVCLCMWSRRWSREQKSAVGMGSPVFGYMATGPTVKTPSVGAPPYQVSIEDRIRWAQIADVMAKSNHYAQPEPGAKPTRPAFGGYPTLPSHTLSMTGTLPLPAVAPPVPLPRLTLTNKSMVGTYGAHSQLGSVHQSSNHGLRSSLETTSSSEEEDRADLLGRNFNTPRPKSRTSIANQSGIYYDVEYDRSDVYSKQNTIPMNTYTLNSQQHQARPYFR